MNSNKKLQHIIVKHLWLLAFNIGLYFKDKTSWLDFEEKIKNDKRVKGIIAINDHESENISDIIEIDFNS